MKRRRKKVSAAVYYVYTWDMDKQAFTPQEGTKHGEGPYTKWGLREALRELQSMGYSTDRNDSFIYVTKDAAEDLRRPA